MDTDEQYINFISRKSFLISLLNQGIVVKSEWDNVISEGESLGMVASVKQLKGYYEHYQIGERA